MTDTWRRRLLGRGVARDAGALWAAQMVIMVTTAAKGVLVARWLGSRDYGITVLVLSYPAVVYALLDARTSETSLRYLSEFRARGEDARALAMTKASYVVDGGVGLAAAVIVLASSRWAQDHVVYVGGTAGLLVVVATASLCRSPTGTAHALFASHDRLPSLARLQVGTSLARSALVLGAAAARPTVGSVVWANAAGMAVEGVVHLVAGDRLVRRTYGTPWTGASLGALRDRRREIVRFVAYADLSSLVGTMAKQLDVVVLGYFRGPTEVGYYSLARSIGGLAGNVVGPLQSAVYPRLARFHALAGRAELRRAVRRAALFVGLPMALAGLAVIPLIPVAVRVLAGPSFAPAGTAAQIITGAGLVWTSCFWLRPLTLAVGRVRFLTVQNTLIAVVTLAIFATTVPRWGFVAMAWAQLGLAVVSHASGAAYVLSRPDMRSGGDGGPPGGATDLGRVVPGGVR